MAESRIGKDGSGGLAASSRRTLLGGLALSPFAASALPPEIEASAEPQYRGIIASAYDALSRVQIQAIQRGTPTTFLAEALNEALAAIASRGGTLFFPAGSYDLRASLRVPTTVYVCGEGPSTPTPTYDPGPERVTGTLLYKNHAEDAIVVEGGSSYAASGGLRHIAISSSSALHPAGAGLVINHVGGYRIDDLRVFGVGGDGIVLGRSPGDVTGQVHMNGVYVNNPGGACIRNRSKWLKAGQIETDGGTHSYVAMDSPRADFSQFHFEGASRQAVVLDGANGATRFAGGFVAMTNNAATAAITLASVAGNTDIRFEAVEIVGHAKLRAGLDIGEAAWRTTIAGCLFHHIPTATIDRARDTTISGTTFLNCGLPIASRGQSPRYIGNRFDATTGPWAIEHQAGGGGIWTANVTDKPFGTRMAKDSGQFGTHIIKDNPGFA